MKINQYTIFPIRFREIYNAIISDNIDELILSQFNYYYNVI